MSIPAWSLPQRKPKPLVTTPCTGQMNPAADGAPVDVGTTAEDREAWIFAVSAAL
jgi:hypothetical protein